MHKGKMRSIKGKLLFLFSLVALFLAIIVISFFVYDARMKNIHENLKLLKEVNYLLRESNAVEKDFLLYETIQPHFFEMGYSKYLSEHAEIHLKIQHKLNSLQESLFVENSSFHVDLQGIKKDIERRDSLFTVLVDLIQKKGFQDHGLIGSFRQHVHVIENSPHCPLDKASLLTIRRHEKDYLLRNQPRYILKWEKAVDRFSEKIKNACEGPATVMLLGHLQAYRQAFLKVVELDNKIGYQDGIGIKSDLHALANKINQNLENLNHVFGQFEARASKQMKTVYLIILIISGAITILVIFLLLRKLGKPVEKLTSSIQDIIQSNFAVNKSIPLIKSKDEMGQLSFHFKEMYHRIQQRTRQLEHNTEEIAAQRDEILRNQEQVNASEEKVREANKKILEQQENITDSIHYAKRIQQAVLPRGSYIKKCIPKHFVLYLPKDIVSGDFYWLTRKANTVMIAAADCTGHGVPGAFMSMLGISFLNDILRKNMKKFFESRLKASDFLEELRKKVKKALGRGKKDNVMKDGMDMAFCIIDMDNRMMQYAGAFNPLLIIRDQEIIKLKATRNPIGSYIWETAFENHELQLQEGDRLYMFSDGFIDQFGGKDDKKFKNKPFEKLLIDIHQKPMAEQHDILKQTLEDWRGDKEQVDDVLVCGFLIP
jgi:serine phosphatase RsbU (regulator of sigma subunit)